MAQCGQEMSSEQVREQVVAGGSKKGLSVDGKREGANGKYWGVTRKWQCAVASSLPVSSASVCRMKAEIK